MVDAASDTKTPKLGSERLCLSPGSSLARVPTSMRSWQVCIPRFVTRGHAHGDSNSNSGWLASVGWCGRIASSNALPFRPCAVYLLAALMPDSMPVCPWRCNREGRAPDQSSFGPRCEAGQHGHDQNGRPQVPAVRQDSVPRPLVIGRGREGREVALHVMEALLCQDAWGHQLTLFILEQVFVAEMPRGTLAPCPFPTVERG